MFNVKSSVLMVLISSVIIAPKFLAMEAVLDETRSEICSICTYGNDNSIILSCKHAFHKECLEQLCKNNLFFGLDLKCSLCRELINSNDQAKLNLEQSTPESLSQLFNPVIKNLDFTHINNLLYALTQNEVMQNGLARFLNLDSARINRMLANIKVDLLPITFAKLQNPEYQEKFFAIFNGISTEDIISLIRMILIKNNINKEVIEAVFDQLINDERVQVAELPILLRQIRNVLTAMDLDQAPDVSDNRLMLWFNDEQRTPIPNFCVFILLNLLIKYLDPHIEALRDGLDRYEEIRSNGVELERQANQIVNYLPNNLGQIFSNFDNNSMNQIINVLNQVNHTNILTPRNNEINSNIIAFVFGLGSLYLIDAIFPYLKHSIVITGLFTLICLGYYSNNRI